MSEEQNQTNKKKVFISYLDDNDQKRSTYVFLISKSQNLITFETKTNVITIPTSRVLKLKEELSEEQKEEVTNGEDYR